MKAIAIWSIETPRFLSEKNGLQLFNLAVPQMKHSETLYLRWKTRVWIHRKRYETLMKYQEKDKIHQNPLTKWRFQWRNPTNIMNRWIFHCHITCFSHLRRCRGTAPEPRYGHAAALVGGRVAWEPSEWALGWGRYGQIGRKLMKSMGKFWKKTWKKKSERSPDFLRELWAFCWSCSVGSDVNASWCFIFVQVDLFLNSLKVLKLKQQTDLRRSHKDQVYFGGRGKTGCFRDLHALDTSSHTWCLGMPRLSLSLLHSMAGCKRDVHHQPVHICGSLLVYDVYVTPSNSRLLRLLFVISSPATLLKCLRLKPTSPTNWSITHHLGRNMRCPW